MISIFEIMLQHSLNNVIENCMEIKEEKQKNALTLSCTDMVEPTLIRLSLRLALLAVGLVISGMSIPVVDVDVQADRFRQGVASTH